jgi:RNA polymerase-binding transcription factor DksA
MGEPAMQSAKLQHYHERLLDERQALVSQRGRVLDAIREEIHPPGENEVIPSEGIDVEMSLDQAAASRLHEIDAALKLIKDGRFGTCSQCGCEIPESRLHEIPSALYCRRCEEASDRG